MEREPTSPTSEREEKPRVPERPLTPPEREKLEVVKQFFKDALRAQRRH
jgi:hypothetical protein